MKIIKKNVMVEKYNPFKTVNETIAVNNNVIGPVLRLDDNSCIVFFDPYQFYNIRAKSNIMPQLDEIDINALRLMCLVDIDDAPEGIKYGNDYIDTVECYNLNAHDFYRFIFS